MRNDQLTPEQRMELMDQKLVDIPFWSLLRVYAGFKLFEGKATIESTGNSRRRSYATWSLSQLFGIFKFKKFLFIGNSSDVLANNAGGYHRLFYSTLQILGEESCLILLKGAAPKPAVGNKLFKSTFLLEGVSYVLAQIIKPRH